MIFGHIPAGFLLSAPLNKISWQSFAQKQKLWLMLVMIFFSAAPDLDLFYFYFVNAEANHRLLPTHAPLPYLVVFCLTLLIAWIKKSRLIAWLAGSMFLGAVLGHLVLDSIHGGVMWLWPFSYNVYGIRGYIPEGLSLFGFSGVFFLLLLETLIVSSSIALLTYRYFKWKKVGYALSIVFLILFTSAISFGNNYLYDAPCVFMADNDKDGMMNSDDDDMDNDGLTNQKDDDIDGDSLNNLDDFLLASRNLSGKLYDRYRGKHLNISKNLGFVNEADIISYPLAQVGILLQDEITKDFAHNPEKYTDTNYNLSNYFLSPETLAHNTPKEDPYFFERVYNYLTYFQNQGKVQPFVYDFDLKSGDVFVFIEVDSDISGFYNSSNIDDDNYFIALALEKGEEWMFLVAHPYFRYISRMPLDELFERFSDPYSVIRIFP